MGVLTLPPGRAMARSEARSSEGRGAREGGHPDAEWGAKGVGWVVAAACAPGRLPSPCACTFPPVSTATGVPSPWPHPFPVSRGRGEAWLRGRRPQPQMAPTRSRLPAHGSAHAPSMAPDLGSGSAFPSRQALSVP